MRRARYIQFGLSLLLLAGALGFVISQAEASELFAVAGHMFNWPLLCVAAIMFVGCLLAAVRLQCVASDLGYRLGLRDAMAVYASGQLAGALFFQLPGQLLARSAMLARRAVPVSGAIVITGYERLCSIIVSLVLAGFAAVYLFGNIHLDLEGDGMAFLKIVVGLAVAMAGGALIGWGRAALDLRPLLARFDPWLFLRTLGLSLLIQLATMAAYVVLVISLVDDVPVWTLAAASGFVMLAASIPISFAGWGMREISAIAVLGAVGVSTQVSLVVAVFMGVISLAAIGLLLPIVWGAHEPPPVTAARPAVVLSSVDHTAALSVVLPLAAATAVFFQIFVPVNRGLLNVNLADPIVILAGAFFIILHFGHGWPVWRVPGFKGFIFAASAVLVLAYLHGLMSIGWSDWAFSNKLLGWFILLCYGATGALIVRYASGWGLDLLLKTFVGVAVAIVALDVAIMLALKLGLHDLRPISFVRMAGLSQNANAFAFMLLLASGVVLAGRLPRSAALLGILGLGLWYAGSRAAFVALPMVLAAAFYMRSLSWPLLARALGIFAGLLILVTAIPFLGLTLNTDGTKLFGQWPATIPILSSPPPTLNAGARYSAAGTCSSATRCSGQASAPT
ncbi:MAG: flippase-like domain-containing protein [Hyphomicrobium sp.]|nr:flippase-like domain-containing protein [Hyphomicrobium sp.]